MADALDSQFVHLSEGAAVVRFQESVYGLEAVMRAAHRFTDRCGVHVEQEPDGTLLVRLTPRTSMMNMLAVGAEFANEALDQRLREKLAAQTEPVRRLLLAQAFSRTNLVRPELDERAGAIASQSGGVADGR